MRRILFWSAMSMAVVLSACGGETIRYGAPLAESGGRIGINVSRLEVREVSLPTYAQVEEIWTEQPDGSLVSYDSLLWADEPSRGVTQELSRQLAAITGAQVAAEPWPFEELPQARVEVRVDEFIAGADGRFRISGQYFAVSVTAGRDRARSFSVSAPITPESGVPGIARARANAVRDLARDIASNGF